MFAVRSWGCGAKGGLAVVVFRASSWLGEGFFSKGGVVVVVVIMALLPRLMVLDGGSIMAFFCEWRTSQEVRVMI